MKRFGLMALLLAWSCGSKPSPTAPVPAAPVAAFTIQPEAPTTGQVVSFTDASSGSPSSWSWTFGDGSTSQTRNPSHVFTAPGTFTVTLVASNAAGSHSIARPLVVSAASDSRLNIVLGRPTGTSIAASVLTDPGTQVYLEYGTASGVYSATTPIETVTTQYPVVVTMTNLNPETRYFYRARYRTSSEVAYRVEPERSFQTRPRAGSTFSFGVQGDSHPERTGNMFNAGLYTVNMQNVAARRPDMYFALGDDFSIEGILDRNQLSQANVDALYRNQRTYFGVMGHSTAVFLVNGNHEQAAAYLLSPRFVTPFADAPIFQGRARLNFFPLPAPDGFYSGDLKEQPGVGLPRDYYAWEWGDALFVTIDPYWHSPVPVDNGVPGVDKTSNTWEATIGDEQYAWLKQVLETSRARYKFVFAHHVLGTFRGAAGIVHQFEWGGYNKNGTAYEFPSWRPRWAKPIHQLMNDTGVTIFFSGHDHVFSRERVDNVVYQSVPNPADNTYTAFNADAYDPDRISLPGARYDPAYGVVLPNAGFLQVTVSPQGVTVSYIRAVLPGDEAKAGAVNGAVAFSYTVPAVSAPAAAATRR